MQHSVPGLVAGKFLVVEDFALRRFSLANGKRDVHHLYAEGTFFAFTPRTTFWKAIVGAASGVCYTSKVRSESDWPRAGTKLVPVLRFEPIENYIEDAISLHKPGRNPRDQGKQ